jgi:stage II sporulation protein GA (sporulation sigma-E factor processing peptidase)
VPIYLDVLMVLNFLVDFLLLLGTNRLAGYPLGVSRALMAGALGGVYGGVCVIPGFTFLAATHWRLVVLMAIAMIAFGVSRDAVRRGILFILLSMALGGVAMGLNRGGFWSLLWAAAAVGAMCILGFRGKIGPQYVPVKIGDRCFIALVDTGNTLTDPMTGQRILVVSSKIGEKLLNVKADKLADPLGLMAQVNGIRLVPFHAVGCSSGILPVKRFENVQLGNWQGSLLVAFAPNELGQGKPYEALTGGVL